MKHRILGTTLQIVELALEPGESVTSVAGELSWMTDSIEMVKSTRMNDLAAGQSQYTRNPGGTPAIYAEYTAIDSPGIVAFSAKLPGHIVQLPLAEGEEYLIHRNGFLCGTRDIVVKPSFQQNMSTGGFSANGLYMRTLSGSGTAFVELNGEMVCYELAEGQVYKVHPGQIGMLSSTINVQLTRISGIRVDDILLVRLTGPGKVWLHSMPISNLAAAIAPYLATRTTM